MAPPARRYPEAILGTTLLTVLVAVPLIIAPGISFHFDVTPKVVVLLLGAAAGLVLWTGFSSGLRGIWKDPRGRLFALLLIAQLGSLGLSTVFSANPELSLSGSHWRRLGLVTHASLLVFAAILLGWLAARPARIRLLLRAVTAGGVIPALYGTLQYFGIDPILPAETYHVGGPGWDIVRPPGTLGHAGYFTIYLLYVAFFALGLAKTDPGRPWRGLGLAVASLSALTICLSGTRAALVGLLIGAAALWAWNRPRLGRRALVATAAVAMAAALFYYSPGGRKLRSRADWYTDDAWGGVRVWLWKDSLAMAARNWTHGTGLDTFSAEFPRYQSVSTARAYPNRYNESPHNLYLDALTAQGVPGLLILLAITAVPVASVVQVKRKERTAGYVTAAFVAALVSSQFFCWTVPTALYFYATAAILISLRVAGKPVPPRPGRWWLGLAVSLPAAAVPVVFAFQLGFADRGLVKVQGLIEEGKVDEAARAYFRVLKWKPSGISYDLWYSRTMASAAPDPSGSVNPVALAEATRAAERACAQSATPHNACYSLAAFYALRNDIPRTEASLRLAIEAAPTWYKAHWMLAQVLHESGRLEEASREATRAMELNGGKDAEVTETWERLSHKRPAPL